MLVLTACDRSAETGNGISDTAQNGSSPSFVAPEDNRLTERHVQQYLAVKNTEKELLNDLAEITDGDPTIISTSRYQDIEEKAAQMNQLSLLEYEWIKTTVINSRIQQQFQEYFALNQQIIALLEGTLQRHEATKKDLKDEEEIAMLDSHVREINEHIQTLKKQIEKYTNLSAAQQHNIAVVTKFQSQLEAVEKQRLSSQKRHQ